MRVFKTKWFSRWAGRQNVTDERLLNAIREIEQGLFDADLGGHVYKKRIANPGQGKRGGMRTLLAFQKEQKAFFIYGFAKNAQDNISDKELKVLKLLAAELLNLDDQALMQALQANELNEVDIHD